MTTEFNPKAFAAIDLEKIDVNSITSDQVKAAVERVLRPVGDQTLAHKDHGSHSNNPGGEILQ